MGRISVRAELVCLGLRCAGYGVGRISVLVEVSVWAGSVCRIRVDIRVSAHSPPTTLSRVIVCVG